MIKLEIKDISKDKVLCSRIHFKDKTVSTNMRFGVGYDIFEEDGIVICQYGTEKLFKYEDSMLINKFVIPYQEINSVSLSISRQPVNKLFLVKPYNYSLDLIIKMNDNFCSHELYLETAAFSLIKSICEYLHDKGVTICDQIDILNQYANDDYELIKEKLNKDYDKLIEKYNLVVFRITDKK